MTPTYHIGLTRDGDTVTVQVARSVDQLSCELWKYYGERCITVRRLHMNARALLGAINADLGTNFQRIRIEKIHDADFTAQHRRVSG
jgi:hypothetical protein